jgi:preprotein translocase subunit SecD
MKGALALCAALLVGCGVGTYQTGRARGELQIRLVARPGTPGQETPRWFSDEVLTLAGDTFVDASQVREVQLEDMPDGSRHIVLYLDDTGREALAMVTREHHGRRLAVVIDRRVVIAPTITSEITEGVAHITVDGDIEQVFDALTRARP